MEAGPSPQLLSDGNYIFFHNSAAASNNAYHAEYVILNGTHPDAPYLERAQQPILSPLYDFELGVAPAECNVANVVFLECVLRPWAPGCVYLGVRSLTSLTPFLPRSHAPPAGLLRQWTARWTRLTCGLAALTQWCPLRASR